MTEEQILAACAECMPALKWSKRDTDYYGTSSITLGLGTLRVYAMVTVVSESEAFATVGSEYVHTHGSAVSYGQSRAANLNTALVRAATHLDYNLNELHKSVYSDLVRRSKLAE